MLTSALAVCLSLLAPASTPTTGPSALPDQVEFGPIRFEFASRLTWPGLYIPPFTLTLDRRRVHRFTLGFNPPPLRWLAFDIVTTEPSEDPELRARTAGVPTGEGSRPYVWTGVRLAAPRLPWQLSIGRSAVFAVASAIAGRSTGLGGGWQFNLIRPLR